MLAMGAGLFYYLRKNKILAPIFALGVVVLGVCLAGFLVNALFFTVVYLFSK
jgi:hypothetical protein